MVSEPSGGCGGGSRDAVRTEDAAGNNETVRAAMAVVGWAGVGSGGANRHAELALLFILLLTRGYELVPDIIPKATRGKVLMMQGRYSGVEADRWNRSLSPPGHARILLPTL